MEPITFSELLLQTAFACMACDGDIDKREVDLIKSLEEKENLFGVDDIEAELNDLVKSINKTGIEFLRSYLYRISQSNLSEDEEIKVARTAIRTVEADEKVEYSEIKFFKIIRSKLNASNKTILQKLSDIENIEEYLEQDIISESYIERLTTDYLGNQTIPVFEAIKLNKNE